MKAPLLVCVLAVLPACAAQQKGEHIPRISVDQEGLAQRLAATAPDPQGGDGVAADEAEEGEPEVANEPASDSPVEEPAEPERHQTDHPDRPQPTNSGDRIAFRSARSEPEIRTDQSLVPSPDPDLGIERDERKERFRRREQQRLGN